MVTRKLHWQGKRQSPATSRQVEVVMKTNARSTILALAMGGLVSLPAAAFNGTITINGEVTAGTCAIARQWRQRLGHSDPAHGEYLTR